MSLSYDNIHLPVFVDIHQEDRHTGAAEIKFVVNCPFPIQRVGRAFHPAITDHKITMPVSVYVTAPKSVSLILRSLTGRKFACWLSVRFPLPLIKLKRKTRSIWKNLN